MHIGHACHGISRILILAFAMKYFQNLCALRALGGNNAFAMSYLER
jgi:hypothetical protein